jgi:hypothetical protein
VPITSPARPMIDVPQSAGAVCARRPFGVARIKSSPQTDGSRHGDRPGTSSSLCSAPAALMESMCFSFFQSISLSTAVGSGSFVRLL